MDQHADLRSLPLSLVIPWLGIPGPWKERKGGQEWSGKCPLHGAQKNNTAFSFHQDGRFNCFSCGKKGRGVIDFLMAYRGVNFQVAVDELKRFNGAPVPAAKPAIKQVQELPTENQPFKALYEKFYVPSGTLDFRRCRRLAGLSLRSRPKFSVAWPKACATFLTGTSTTRQRSRPGGWREDSGFDSQAFPTALMILNN